MYTFFEQNFFFLPSSIFGFGGVKLVSSEIHKSILYNITFQESTRKKKIFEQFRLNIFKHNLWYLFLHIYNLILVLQHDIRHLSISLRNHSNFYGIQSRQNYTRRQIYEHIYIRIHLFCILSYLYLPHTVRTHFVAKMKKY